MRDLFADRWVAAPVEGARFGRWVPELGRVVAGVLEGVGCPAQGLEGGRQGFVRGLVGLGVGVDGLVEFVGGPLVALLQELEGALARHGDRLVDWDECGERDADVVAGLQAAPLADEGLHVGQVRGSLALE